MKVYSKILALFAATTVYSYSLEGRVKREIEDQCTVGIAQFDDCFTSQNVDQLCSNYNSQRCQSFVADPVSSVPACQSLSQEQQQAVKSDVFNRVIFPATVASIQCAKDESGNFCSQSTESDVATKLTQVINDAAKSKQCTDNAVWALNYVVSDNANVTPSNEAVAAAAKQGLETLAATQKCLAEVAEIDGCFQGDNVDQLCASYNSEKCQAAVMNPISAAPSCQSLPQEQQDAIKSDLFNRVIFPATVASIQCAKDESANFCSQSTESDVATKLTQVINDAAKSKQCTDNAVWALNYVVSDNANVTPSNEAVAAAAKQGLETLAATQKCLAEVAEIDGCFQGDNVDQLCASYNSEKCQAAVMNPISAAPSCQSLPQEQQDAIKSDLFNRVIFPATVASIQCAKDESANFCSQSTESDVATKLTQVINDAAKSKQCTDNAVWALNYVVSDNANVTPSNEAVAAAAKQGLETLAATQKCLAEVAEIDGCFQGDNVDQLCANYNSEKCQAAVINPISAAPSCQSLPQEQQDAIKSDLFNRVIFQAGAASIQCAKDENDAYCTQSTDLLTAVTDSCKSKKCTDNATYVLNYMISDNGNVAQSNDEMVAVAKQGLDYLNSQSCGAIKSFELESDDDEQNVEADGVEEEDSASDDEN